MLKKKFRLKKKYEFQYLYKKGVRLHSASVTLLCAQNKHHTSKFGFVVSKKIGNSVVRNAIKRKLRACIDIFLPNIKSECNCMFIAKDTITQIDFSSLCLEIKGLLQKAGIWYE